MKNYLKLVDFELKRFWKIYAVLIGIIVVGESLAIAISAKSFAGSLERAIRRGEYTEQKSLEMITNTDLFSIPIVICLVILGLYIFFMWYREWFAKNTFAYQLLTLPTKRMTIFYAKFTAVLLFIGGCLIVQIAMYPVLNGIYEAIIPEVGQRFGTFSSWVAGSSLIHYIIPASFFDFLYLYGVGITAVAAVFTIIIIERSYRIKGILLGVLYGVLSFVILLLPLVLQGRFHLYYNEFLIVATISLGFLFISSLVISTHLMNKKIWI